MVKPRTYKTRGIVLKGMPLGEADRIITIHTPDLGKLRVVARGVRRVKSRMSGHLEPLTYVRVSVAEGKAIDTVTDAEIIESFRELREDLALISKGLYLAELLDQFTADRSQARPEFELLLDGLRWLQDADSGSLLLRYFEVKMLATSGFGPEVFQCVECNSELKIGNHEFSSLKGGILGPECRDKTHESLLTLSVNVIKVLRYLQNESYERVAELNIQVELLGQVERLLGSYIRHVLEKRLKSAEFMGLVS